jgi:hypothetical protein
MLDPFTMQEATPEREAEIRQNQKDFLFGSENNNDMYKFKDDNTHQGKNIKPRRYRRG